MSKLVNQPSLAPTEKMKAVAGAGALLTAVVALLAHFGVIVPDSVTQAAKDAVAYTVMLVAAVQAVLTFVAGYLKKSKR